jgi:hypothetical protein
MKRNAALAHVQDPAGRGEASASDKVTPNSGKPSLWKRFFGSAPQPAPKAMPKNSVAQPSAAVPLKAVESAFMALAGSGTPAQPVTEAERGLPTAPVDSPVAQDESASNTDDPGTSAENGGTAWLLPSSFGQLEATALLLAQGADANCADQQGRTLLHQAVLYGSKEVTELLLDHGANVNARNAFGLAPLHTAARFGMHDLAELLIARGADVNLAGNHGATPLLCAIERGQGGIAALLRQNGAEESAAVKEAPVGALIPFAPVDTPCENPAPAEFTRKGEGQSSAAEMSREEIRTRRAARRKAARGARRAHATEAELHTAVAA